MKDRNYVGGSIILAALAATSLTTMETHADGIGNLGTSSTPPIERVAEDDGQQSGGSTLLAALPAGLYGVSSSSPGELYSMNTSTGAATSILTLSDGLSFTGVEELAGEYFVTDFFGGSCSGYCFGKFDSTTGAITWVSDQDGSWDWCGLADNEGAGVMYTVDFDAGDVLKTVDSAGNTVVIGATGVYGQGNGLAYDEASGTLYSIAYDGNLYTLNTSTGASTLIGPTGIGPFSNLHQGLAWDAATSTLYLNEADTYDSLYILNTATGTATLVGPNGATAGSGIDGLMVIGGGAPCPEDVNGDGVVDVLDLLAILSAWGPC